MTGNGAERTALFVDFTYNSIMYIDFTDDFISAHIPGPMGSMPSKGPLPYPISISLLGAAKPYPIGIVRLGGGMPNLKLNGSVVVS